MKPTHRLGEASPGPGAAGWARGELGGRSNLEEWGACFCLESAASRGAAARGGKPPVTLGFLPLVVL